jgi:adenylate cyclase
VAGAEDQSRATGTLAGVKPGALTDLLRRMAGAPEEEQGRGWGAVLHTGAMVGRFELVQELGRGGFGVVWEAKDRELGRKVAFKAVRAGGKTSLREERLLEEAEAAARLQHPNIVTLFDVGRVEQGPYLVLELLRGQTLAERLSPGARPVQEALHIGVEVAKGVAHAHGQGVIHRDLKPENVFLCQDGQVKVLDFGLAHAFGQRKVDGGTKGYMAPEQLRGAPEDERTDVFALGVILHELLSGKPAFPGEGPPGRERGPPPPLEVAEVPSLGPLVARMLSTDPVRRPRDGGEVLQALATVEKELVSAGAKEGLVARPVTFISELRRRRVFRALVAYAIFAFAVLQVIEPVMHGLHLPDWVLSVAVVLLALGCPVTVALSWIYDLTRHGIRRTEVSPTEARDRAPWGRRLAPLLGLLGLVASAPGVAWYLWKVRPPGMAPFPAEATAPSIAVLPFADLSPGHDQEYFSDGVAEEILNALGQVEGLKVSGRTSSFSFKGTNRKIAEIGQELNVGNVLEGSVRRVGGRIRITAQLVKTADGFHLWSQSFDRVLSDVLAVQEEIAQAVVRALKMKLAPDRGRPRAGGHPLEPEAYRQYLLGRDYTRRGIKEQDLRLAAEAYGKAIGLEPGFASAWAGLSGALLGLSDYAPTPAGFAESRQRSLAAAEKAVALDPRLPDGYLARAWVQQVQAWDFVGARADIEKAYALAPGDVRANRDRGQILSVLGRPEEAIASLREAVVLDPLDGVAWTMLGTTLKQLGDIAGARAAFGRAQDSIPDGLWNHLGELSLLEGQPAAALAAFERAPMEVWRTQGVALARHGLGQTGAADAALAVLTTRFADNWAYQIAGVYAWRGDRDAAFEWLDRAYRQRDGGLVSVKFDSLLRSLRADPRFPALLRKLNLPVD